MVLTIILNKLATHKPKKQAKKTLKVLNDVKKNKKYKLINTIQNNLQDNSNLQNPINYILNIKVSKTNTLINLSNIKGDPLLSFSGGSINLKKKQKKLQPLALVNLLKSLILKAGFINNKTIALHFQNIKPYYESLIVNLLKKVVFIKLMKSSNLQPHNGCRPKKIKRFKKRTKRSWKND